MARVIKRVAAKRDLTDHFVFLGDKASVDVARRFLHACNVSFQALAHMPELGTQRSFRNPRFSSVRAWPVKSFERYLIFYRPLTDGVEILRVIQLRQRHRTPFSLEFPDYSTVRIRGFRHDRGRGLSLLCCGFLDSAGSGFQSACLREAILATQ